jgi:hypothetical protein
VAILGVEQVVLDLTEMKLRSLWKRGRETHARKPCRRFPRFAATVLASLVSLAGGRPILGQGSAASEYEVKAAFLYHFAQFVEWPQEAFKEASSPLTYCTLGEDPFRGALDASLSGKTIGARPLQVRHLKPAQEIQGCHVLFIGEGEKKLLPAVLAMVKGSPLLIVGESERFARDGGMIGFCLEENKIRFEINLEAAERVKLKISSRLLTLAKTVIGGERGT